MMPRKLFKIRNSLDEMYEIDGKYTRFSEAREVFVTVGQKDTGEIGTDYYQGKMARRMMENMGQNIEGKSRLDYALAIGAGAVNFIIGTFGEQNANRQFLKWTPLFVPQPLSKSPAPVDQHKLTLSVKNAARLYGADLVGITALDRRWLYERNIYKPYIFGDVEQPMETEEGFVIPNSITKAVVLAISMNRDLVLESPRVGAQTGAQLGYSAMGSLVVPLAEFIRALGYNAIPCLNDTALSIPLAVSAGLGQLGRFGLLITPEYGACIRLGKVLTDMPLNLDSPVDFGQTEFCDQCLVCARNCPADAISPGARVFSGPTENNNPGVKKWYINPEKCLRFWQDNGAACASCIAACPFTMETMPPTQCLECERCIAPECPLYLISRERQRHEHQ